MITYGKDLDSNYDWSDCKSKIYNIMVIIHLFLELLGIRQSFRDPTRSHY